MAEPEQSLHQFVGEAATHPMRDFIEVAAIGGGSEFHAAASETLVVLMQAVHVHQALRLAKLAVARARRSA